MVKARAAPSACHATGIDGLYWDEGQHDKCCGAQDGWNGRVYFGEDTMHVPLITQYECGYTITFMELGVIISFPSAFLVICTVALAKCRPHGMNHDGNTPVCKHFQ